MYFSYEQRSPASMRLAVRTTGMSAPIASRVREILHDLDPDVPLAAPAFMDEILADSLGGRRAVMVLLATFAGVALVLAAVGLYGVLAYQVARRTHEIGVRMALGSSVAGVVRSVVRSGFVLVGIGVVLGIPTSLLAARLIRSLLYEVGPSSPLPYLGTLLFLGAVGAIATLLPARRAARVDPVVSFRAE
jgi:putative ABC transport system permease protein